MKKILYICMSIILLASVAQAAAINQVAAVVNGRMISYFDLQRQAASALAKEGIDAKKSPNSPRVREIYAETLDNMILELLIVDAAEKQGLAATTTEIDAEIGQMMQQSGLSKANFEKQMKKEGLSIQALQARIGNSILRQKLMGAMVGRKIVVTPDEVRAYYNANLSKFVTKSETVLALLAYPDNVDADILAARIKKDTKKFEVIAKQISVGPNKEGGGVIGPVDFSKMPPQLVKFIKAVPEGGVSPVIMLNGKRTQFKVIKSTKGGTTMTFAEAEPIASQMVREPRLKARFEEYVKQLREKAVVDIRI